MLNNKKIVFFRISSIALHRSKFVDPGPDVLRKDEREHDPDQGHQGHLPGFHRQAGNIPLQTGHRVRNKDGRWSFARKGRKGTSGIASLQLRCRGQSIRHSET